MRRRVSPANSFDQDLVAALGNIDCYERRLRRRRLASGHRRFSKVTVGTFTLETCRRCPTRGGGATLANGFAPLPLDRRGCVPNVLRAGVPCQGGAGMDRRRRG